MSPAAAATLALRLCEELGFAAAGIAEAVPSAHADNLRDWLAQGKHGSMDYLARHVETRLDPARVLQGARTAIVVADRYAERGSVDGLTPPMHGRVARYARGRDYHAVVKRRLHALCDRLREAMPGEEFRAVVDTAPVLERELAARAGIGWVGKHTLVIRPGQGSYLLLGCVLTTATLKLAAEPVADHCGTCTRCIDACPTRAITPYSVDASRCISYLTIERRLPIDPALYAPIGDWLYGCDVCQEVCPHNSASTERPARDAPAKSPIREDYAPRFASLDLLEVLGWGAADRSRALSGSAMKRATLAMLKRNAILVLGNELAWAPHAAALERVRAIAGDGDEPEMVREAALAVLARLGDSALGDSAAR